MENKNVLVGSQKFEDFPAEILVDIFSWLPLKDIASLSQTCRVFNKITKVNQLWTKLCLNYYNIQVTSAKGFAQKFCKNVLHKYGHLLGFWIKEDYHCSHGGLLHILYRDGQLLGFDLQVPKPSLNRTEPLHPKSLFRIYMEEGNNDEATIKCCLSQATSQLKMDLEYILKQGPATGWTTTTTITTTGRATNCSRAFLNLPKWYLVTSHRDGKSAWMSYQNEQYERIDALQSENKVDKNDEHFDVGLDDDGLVEDVDLKYRIIHPSHYSRLQLPQTPTFPVPAQVGMFTAITAYVSVFGNGIKLARQLVLLSYDDQGDEEKVTGLFMTRDSNLRPVGELSFKADLRHCITFDQKYEQKKIQVNWKDLPPQPFQIPPIFLEQFPDLPDICLAKFQGFATIVNEYAANEDQIPYGLLTEGHWIVFTENVLGFLVTNDQQPQMTIYHRVIQNPLLLQS